MGLDYGFDIICDRNELWSFIDSVVELDQHGDGYTTTLVWGEQRKVVPFWLSNECNTLSLDAPHNDRSFCLSLPFIMDNKIRGYLRDDQETFRKQNPDSPPHQPQFDSQGRVYIGCIYFYIVTDLVAIGRTGYDKNLVWFEFKAATNRMSRLFQNSQSIHKTFVQLAKKHEALCCLFASGGTGEAKALWLDGQECYISLADDWLPMAEIRERAAQ
jgi:hypothetical protein